MVAVILSLNIESSRDCFVYILSCSSWYDHLWRCLEMWNPL